MTYLDVDLVAGGHRIKNKIVLCIAWVGFESTQVAGSPFWIMHHAWIDVLAGGQVAAWSCSTSEMRCCSWTAEKDHLEVGASPFRGLAGLPTLDSLNDDSKKTYENH